MAEREMRLGLTEPLRLLVVRKFEQARRGEDLIFSDTQLAVLRSRSGIPFQLRYCPALAKKPQNNKPDAGLGQSKPKPDPFDQPAPELLVSEVPLRDSSHNIVLNKYPIIKHHFILATKANKPQTDLLEPDDLGLAYACIKAWQDDLGAIGQRELFAFFNSGEHSGASQVHRHLQFLPIEDMIENKDSDWRLLLERMTQQSRHSSHLLSDRQIPFLHCATQLPADVTPADIHAKYLMLMKWAWCATQQPGQDVVDIADARIEENGQTTFSYNLALTSTTMAIFPRRQESAAVPGAGDASSVAINGTILGGTLMVKNEEEWNVLRRDPSILDDMLLAIGYEASGHSSDFVSTRL